MAHTDNILAAYIAVSGHTADIGHIAGIGVGYIFGFECTVGDAAHTFGFELSVDPLRFLADSSIVLWLL